MQAGLSSILLRRPHLPFGGEAKGLDGILDGASYDDRDPHRSLCPYGERCIGWFCPQWEFPPSESVLQFVRATIVAVG